MEKLKKGTTIQSLEIGMGILDFIAHQAKPCKFTEIQEYTQITKSNLYKYLNTFTHLGILYRDRESGSYVLGSKLIEYGMAAVDQENVLDRITPYLEELNSKTQSTVLFSIWTHSGPMVIKMLNVSQGFNIGAQIGTVLPPNSATGKIFMAFMDETIVRDWKEVERNRILPDQLQELEAEVSMIKEKEISFGLETLVPSASSISFPVLNYKKELLGAVTVVGFLNQIPTNEDGELSKSIIEISKVISKSFGYDPSQLNEA
ncbi:IclR family transcriptional regulator [Bacillus sp. EB600]|uniref:IclR family transcriptional regulator n=1 Tax=Bacillus sp. EB600 TaxID=2806345 RepID=UPI00210AE816|nr:IclR family transcriptional regulator [Bacillus sp. EB600]MCQ6280507.1 IclR family transcriptional regulator [Bacillus sp. EB600]